MTDNLIVSYETYLFARFVTPLIFHLKFGQHSVDKFELCSPYNPVTN